MLETINQILDNPKTGLKRINKRLNILWEQAEKVTFGLDEVKETLDSHTASLKRIEEKAENSSDDIRKLDKRLTEVEHNQGIIPPPGLTVVG